MNPLLRTLIADGVEAVVRGLAQRMRIRVGRGGAVAVSDLLELDRALRRKGYRTPSFNLNAYKDFLQGAVRASQKAAEMNRRGGQGSQGSDAPLFQGNDPSTTRHSYQVVFTVRYPDGTTGDAVIDVRSNRALSPRELRERSQQLMEDRLSIVSFPGEQQGQTGLIERYRVIAAYRGDLP